MKYTACFFAAALAAVTLAAPAAEPQSPWGPSNNPMNGAGVAHNAYLGCMLARDPTGQRSPLEVLVYDCGMPVEGARDAYVAQNKDFFNQSHFNADKSLSENLDPYRSRYSAAQFSYIQGIDQIFATAASLSEVESKLAALEDHAVASLARGPADLQILGGVSVTRASLQQWKSRKNPANEMIFATSFGYNDAQRIAVADANGYLAGGNLYNGPFTPTGGLELQLSITESWRAALNADW